MADAFERPRGLVEYLSSEEGWHEFKDVLGWPYYVLGWPEAKVGAFLGVLVLLLKLRAGLSLGERIERTTLDVLDVLSGRFEALRFMDEPVGSDLAFAVILHGLLKGDIKQTAEVAGWASER